MSKNKIFEKMILKKSEKNSKKVKIFKGNFKIPFEKSKFPFENFWFF